MNTRADWQRGMGVKEAQLRALREARSNRDPDVPHAKIAASTDMLPSPMHEGAGTDNHGDKGNPPGETGTRRGNLADLSIDPTVRGGEIGTICKGKGSADATPESPRTPDLPGRKRGRPFGSTLAHSKMQTQPWKAAGKSRAQWYRDQKRSSS